MKFQELNDKTELELEKMLQEAKNRLRDLRFRVSRRELKKVRDIRETRQLIARLHTITKRPATETKPKN